MGDVDLIYRLRKTVPVTSKKDPICSNNVQLFLEKSTTFGRVLSDEVNVRLLSKVTPLMISRKHATVCVSSDGLVNICDHDSINGVYINGKRIRPGVYHELQLSDTIAFGCGVGNNSPEFEYTLEKNFSNKHRLSQKLDHIDITSPSKRPRLVESPVITIIESNSAQITEQEEKIKNLTYELEQKELKQNELLNKLEEKEKGLLDKLEQQKFNLETEKEEAEKKLKKLLEEQLLDKENVLRSEYDEQIHLLQNERDLVEKNLQDELSKKLNEKDKAYQEVLEKQKDMLDQAMLSKEKEKSMLITELQAKDGLIEKYRCVEENQKQLEDCLEELRKEIVNKDLELQKQKEAAQKVELDAKQTVIQTMEDEFTCIICQELFIEATTLPCAHTFCELCLRLWMRKKKNCPVCRRRIKDKAVRSIVLDSAVNKMIDATDDDSKLRRSEIIRERAELKRKDDAAEDPEGVKNMIHRPGEDDGNDDIAEPQRNDRNTHYDNRNNRRDNHRRRSRSRSPRYHNYRHRPYSNDHRNNNYDSYPNNAGFHQNVGPIIHQLNNNTRYYPDRTGHQFYPGTFHNQQHFGAFSNNVQRCYNCGGTDHIARFCPRN